jgi:hypothetical protein
VGWIRLGAEALMAVERWDAQGNPIQEDEEVERWDAQGRPVRRAPAQQRPRDNGRGAGEPQQAARPAAPRRVAEAAFSDRQKPFNWLDNLAASVPFAKDVMAAGDATGLALNSMLSRLTGEQSNAAQQGLSEDFGENYRGSKAALDEAQRQYFEDNPAGGITSSMMAPVGSIGQLANLRFVKPAAEAAPLIERGVRSALNAAASGGAMGAAMGATTGEGDLASIEGLSERLKSTLHGGGAGALLGPLMAAGAKVAEPIVGPAMRGIDDILSGDQGQRAARRKLAEMMGEADITAEEATRTLTAGAVAGKPIAPVDALGATGSEATAGLVHAGGDARQIMTDFLHNRDMGQPAIASSMTPQSVRPSSQRDAQRLAIQTQINQVDDEMMQLMSPLRRSIDPEADKASIPHHQARRARLQQALDQLDQEDIAAGTHSAAARTPEQVRDWTMLREGGSADRIVQDLGESLSRDGRFQTRDAVTQAKAQQAANDYARFEMERPLNFANHNELAVDFYDMLVPTPALQEAVKRAATSAQNRFEGPERQELRGLQNFLKQMRDDGKTKPKKTADDSVRSLIEAHFPGQKGKSAPAGAERPMDWANAAANRLSLSPRTLLTIKQALDELVLEAQRTWTKERRPLDAGTLRDLTAVSKELRAFMDQAYPKSFPQANGTFSGYAKMESAYDLGRDIRQMTQEEVAEAMKGLVGTERELFELGARDAMIDVVKKTPDGANEVRRVFGTVDMRDKLALVFSDGGRLNDFAQRLSLENLMFAPTTRALRNSTTAGNIFAADRYAGAQLPTNGANWLQRLAESIVKPVTKGATERTNRALAQTLTDTDTGRAANEFFEAEESVARRLARSLSPTAGAMAGASNKPSEEEEAMQRRRRRHAASTASR